MLRHTSVLIALTLVFATATAFAQTDPVEAPAETEVAAPATNENPAAASPTVGKLGAGLLFGNGFEDGFNLGFGARVGYTLPMKLYLGGTFVYHLGKSEDVMGTDVSVNVMYFGGEVGYDVSAGPVVIRPYAGLGMFSATASVGDESTSESKFGVWPGATLLVPIGNLYAGADLRYAIVSDLNTFSAFATVGMHF